MVFGLGFELGLVCGLKLGLSLGLVCRDRVKCIMKRIKFNFYTRGRHYFLYFIHEKLEGQKGRLMCPRITNTQHLSGRLRVIPTWRFLQSVVFCPFCCINSSCDWSHCHFHTSVSIFNIHFILLLLLVAL